MRLEKLYLKNYLRLYVSGIREVTYEPNKKIQIILGKNGSGKSSLLQEVVPNVIDDKLDYGEGGLKEIFYSHNGKQYHLGFDRDSGKYFFKVDQEELNPTGLLKIQKQLIEDEFSITKDIHELLLSNIGLTNMSVGERKRWFTSILTDVDYNLALKIYNQAKNRMKELQAYIKLTKSKLISDENLLSKLDKDAVTRTKNDIANLNRLLEALIEAKEPYEEFSYDNLLRELDLSLNSAERLLADLSTMDVKHDSMEERLKSVEYQHKSLVEKRDRLKREIGEIEDLKISNSEDKQALEKERENLIEKRDRLLKENFLNLEISSLKDLYNEFSQSVIYLTELQSEMLEFKTYYSYISDIARYKEQNILLEKSVHYNNTKLLLLEEKIKQMENLKEHQETCPNCKHTWIPNFDIYLYEKAIKERKDLENKLKHLTEEHEENDTIVKKTQHLLSLHEKFKNYFQTKSSQVLLNYILTETDMFENIAMLSDLITKIQMMLESISSLPDIEDRLKEIDNKLEIFKHVNSAKLEAMFGRLESLKNDFSKTIEEINYNYKTIEKYKVAVEKHRKLKSILDSLLEKKKILKKSSEAEAKRLRNSYLSKTIMLLKKIISEEESNLVEMEILKERYMGYVEEIGIYEKRLASTNILIDMLSPNKGIIGRSVTKSINEIIEKMNDVINQVWSYEIKIEPCDINDSDLTFRFPVKINGVKSIKDVSKGSSGIKDIIDLAFKIVAMEYLDLLEYPLILDEFGNTMDPEHRVKAYDYIESLSKTYFSQIYIVSHFETMYNRFIDVDVNILNNEGLGYTQKYNEVLKIK